MRQIPLALMLLSTLARAQEYGEDFRLKVDIAGETRKIAFFVPKDRKKGEALPLLVAVPGTDSKAFLEIGQWQQPGCDMRFAVVSVDVTTNSARGWAAGDQLEMQRDCEAVLEAIKLCQQTATENGITLDPSATVITGWSGGGYLTMWLGLRRPDVFFGICGRGIVFLKDIAKFGKLDSVPRNLDMPIFLYRGELDNPRVMEQVSDAKKALDDLGFKNVTLETVPRMLHESKPEVFLEWYGTLLKSTAKGRADAVKIAAEVKELREMYAQGKGGVLSKLAKLVEREKKGGFPGGAGAFAAEIEGEAAKDLKKGEDLEGNGALFEAADLYKEVERKYTGIEASKSARDRRLKLMKSDGYKAAEWLAKAKELKEKGQAEKAAELLLKITETYPETAAAAEAESILKSG